MIRKLLLGGVAVLACASAHATKITVTYTGTVTSGYDNHGVFGDPLANLTGQAFRASFTYDTLLGRYSSWSPGEAQILGGPYYASNTGAGYGSPVIKTSFTVKGVTRSFSSPSGAIQIGSVYPNSRYMILSALSFMGNLPAGSSYDDLQIYADNPLLPTVVDAGFGRLHITNLSSSYQFGTTAGTDLLHLRPLTVRATAGTAVPEPGAWAMMISGFAMVGAALRRSGRSATAAA